MSKQRAPLPDEHPTLAVLTLYLEGELTGRDLKRTRAHVQDCWQCRRELETLKKGAFAFVDYYRNVLVQSLPVFQDHVGFPWRLRAEASRYAAPSLWRILAGHCWAVVNSRARPAWISGAISIVTIFAVLHFALLEPPPIEASEFLRRACSAQPPVAERHHSNLHRTVRIRRGGFVFVESISNGTAKVAGSTLDESTRRALSYAGVDWLDPLNPRHYAAWHRAQAQVHDHVFYSPGSLTLRTTLPGGAAILYASFTVNRADWRPIAEHVEFRNQPAIDITELSNQVMEVAPPVKIAVAPRITPALPHDASAPERPHEVFPTDAQLQNSEVLLRESFHRIGADVSEIPTIQWNGRQIQVVAFAETPQRRQAILAAIQDVPYVTASVYDPENLPKAAQQELPQSSQSAAQTSFAEIHTVEPPLAQSLAEYLGGLDAANNFLVEERKAFLDVLVPMSALKRLADRYPDAVWNVLTFDSQRRLNAIAADAIVQVQANSRQYAASVSAILRTMAARKNMPALNNPVSNPPSCASWRVQAAPVLDALQKEQTSFRHLFIAYQSATAPGAASDGLAASLAARITLENMLAQLCRP